ncbi:MAG: thermonuclease family protein [Planctomycetota bacterium]|jgi:endonuclease YncB( thermonuclease family)
MDRKKAKSSKSRIAPFLAQHNISILTGILLAASLYFFVGANRMRSATTASNPHLFSTGDIVDIVNVVDGDEVLIGDGKGNNTLFRLLGIKSFSATVSDPLLSEYGKICFTYLKAKTANQKAGLEIADKELDTEGRLLGTLFLKGSQGEYTVDLGLDLVRKGYTLVYTRFDFAGMKDYLGVQKLAQEEKAGLWSNERIAARALALQLLWDEEKQND